MEGNIIIYINHVRRNIHTYTRARVRARGVFNDSHRVNPNSLDQSSAPTSKPSSLLKDCLSATQLRERIRDPLSFAPKRVLCAFLLENDKGLGRLQSRSIQRVLERFSSFSTRRQKCLSARHTKPPLISTRRGLN